MALQEKIKASYRMVSLAIDIVDDDFEAFLITYRVSRKPA